MQIIRMDSNCDSVRGSSSNSSSPVMYGNNVTSRQHIPTITMIRRTILMIRLVSQIFWVCVSPF